MNVKRAKQHKKSPYGCPQGQENLRLIALL